MSHTLRHFAFHLCVLFGVTCSFIASGAAAPLVIKDDYRSPRNPERNVRTSTRLIVLHTTEAHASSALNKLSERGEAHYCVTDRGEIYRIIDREREAFHAGRSMWNAREDCDEYSIGIEVVGNHDKSMPLRQLEALKRLVDWLKKIYKLQDVQVIAHSHVAYGAPNKWFKCKHRGRKRCGMLFAMPSVRTKLGLLARPAYDPDVKAKRLIQADPYLNEVLYGSRDTMARVYGTGRPQLRAAPIATGKALPKKPVKIAPAKPATRKPSTQKANVKPVPTAKTTPARKNVKTAAAAPAVAPKENAGTGRSWLTLIGLKGGYFQKRPQSGAVPVKPAERQPSDDVRDLELLVNLPGYVRGGPVNAKQTPYKIAGAAWKAKTTYYYLPDGKIVRGDQVDEKLIKPGTIIFYKK